MASELEHAVDILTGRVESLIARHDALLREITILESRMAEMQAEADRLRVELQTKTTDCDFLAMSHRLASSPDQLIQTRRLIAKMIRNIDRALEDLR